MAPEPVDTVDAIMQAWSRERPGTPVEGMAVVSRAWRLSKIFGAQRRRVLADAGADPATLDLLSVLRRSGAPYELPPGEIARRAMVTAGAVSQRLARAESDGLVERSRAAGSRRKTVRLLPAGHDLVDALVGRVAALDDDLLSGLAPEQRRQLDGLLRALLVDVEERFGGPAPSQVGHEGPEY